jgi:rRNA-processing protein FCF1
MQEVLIDTCGWVAIVDSGINIDTSLNGLVGPFQLLLLENVKHELDDLANEKKNLLLPLIYSKAELIKALEESTNHTDDQLVDMANHRNCAVLTVDRGLKKRLIESSCRVIEVVSNKRLRLATD